MKAVINETYGTPDVLQLKEVAKPTPKDNEVLVRVVASSVNAADWHILTADIFLVRLKMGLFKPKRNILGSDIAGQVEAVGKNVKNFKPGDAVFGNLFANELGCFTEYVAVPEDALALKPANLSFDEAAATPLAAITALQGLRDQGQIRPGQKVLINGASGGVGTFAVQIARYFGAEVTAVCSTRNVEMARRLGADHVIDYTKEDFTQNGQQYDLIFDTIGNLSLAGCRRALKPDGICAVAGFGGMRHLFEIIVLGGKKIGMMAMAQPNQKDLLILRDLLESGKIVPVVEKTYALPQTAEAIRHLETGHARGKVVVTVA